MQGAAVWRSSSSASLPLAAARTWCPSSLSRSLSDSRISASSSTTRMNSSGLTFLYNRHIRSGRRRSTADMTPNVPPAGLSGTIESWRTRESRSRLGDVAAVCGKDEHGLYILRRRSADGPVEAGVVRPLVEGKAIAGEVVSMRPREDVPFLFDVKTEVAGAARGGTGDARPRAGGDRFLPPRLGRHLGPPAARDPPELTLRVRARGRRRRGRGEARARPRRDIPCAARRRSPRR